MCKAVNADARAGHSRLQQRQDVTGAWLYLVYSDRRRCSLHTGVPFRKRRHGSTGCWICLPPNPKNPYIEPLPGPGDPEYEKYRTVVAA